MPSATASPDPRGRWSSGCGRTRTSRPPSWPPTSSVPTPSWRARPGATSSCAPAATRSRAAPPRSSRTSSPSACSACPGSSRRLPERSTPMDFGLTDDQRDIQRTARELLADRASPERVREHAEAGRHDDRLWSELRELGWPGIAIPEEHGGQGLGGVELAILSEELGCAVAPVPFLPSVMAAAVIEAAGSPEQRERWLPGLAGGELVGAVAAATDGAAGLVPSGADADLVVLVEDGSARVVTRDEAALEAVAAIAPTRPAARVATARDAGEQLAGDVAAGVAR